MITVNKLNKLSLAEQEIENLLNQNEANWKDIAKIAIAVQEKKLFEQAKLKSFTAWVNAVAQKCDRSPSLIWRYIKAAKYYLHTVDSKDINLLDEASAPPEALERLEKIERNAPQPVFEKLKKKVLEGEATVRECREIELEYRPEDEQLRRGRPAKGKEGSYQHLGKVQLAEVNTEAIEINNLPRNQVAATISRSLKINLVDWTKTCSDMQYPPKHYKEHTEVRVNLDRRRLRLDFLAVVRWSYKRPKDVFVVEIKSSLSDFEFDTKWENYLNFCHYFCFAIPSNDDNLKEAIELRTEAGILLVDMNSEISDNLTYPVIVYRQPKKNEGSSISLVYETLYERILGWSGT
jgi:DNA repair protein MmcB-like